MTVTEKRLKNKLRLQEHERAPGFWTAGASSHADLNLDPFLNIDLFRMNRPIFPPHPHAGFSAVTYMLPESSGQFQNRDSLGDQSLINPGDIHWTQAGAGMMHEETPAQAGTECRGFQIFVNLRSGDKLSAPRAFHAAASELPRIESPGGQVTVVAGKLFHAVSPLGQLATPVNIFDVAVKAQAILDLELRENLNWFVFTISGDGSINNEPICSPEIVTLSPDGRQVSVAAGSKDFRLLLCGGTPICEPIVWGGPFAMNSSEELRAAQLRYQAGKMGKLAASF